MQNYEEAVSELANYYNNKYLQIKKLKKYIGKSEQE